MRISMFTNTYLPIVGGVARSVSTYEDEFRRRGHDVCVIAPKLEGAGESNEHVLRVPSLQNVNGSGFAIRWPQPFLISDFVEAFRPQVVHTHHPFLLGDAALRTAYARRLPLVFTYHTMYEEYTHNLPLDSEAMKRVAVQMATEYSNLCHHVIAPSRSVETLLRQRGVTTPITVIPTGIDLQFFDEGDRKTFRQAHGIPADALVIGHVGRLTEEKNLSFLAASVGLFLSKHPNSVFLIVGDGTEREVMDQILSEHVNSRQYILAGRKTGQDLADAYAAMDVFVFSSLSETQGMVVAEALAAGNPVVALDGPGVREVIEERNGQLLSADASPSDFAAAIRALTTNPQRLWRIADQAQMSVETYSLESCADKLHSLYERLIDEAGTADEEELESWIMLEGRLEAEWKLMVEKASALSAAVVETTATRAVLS